MPDRPRTHESFRRAADREHYEVRAIVESLPQNVQKLIADAQDKSTEERERTEQRQRQGRESEVQQEQRRLENEDAPKNVLPPPSFANTPQTKNPLKNMVSVRTRAERIVDDRHKAERDAVDTRLQKTLETTLARHAMGKVRGLDKDRQSVEELAARIRADRDATRTDKDQRNDPSPAKSEDEQTRQKEFLQRVAARIRKSKERDARTREHDHERD